LDDARMAMIINNHEEKHYDVIGNPIFSPDNDHMAYVAKTNSKWIWVINRQEINLNIKSIIDTGPIVFDGKNKLHGLGILDNPDPEFFRFEVTILH
jgi:hypothetical protein